MPRKTVGVSRGEEIYDYDPLVSPGITMLKFGRGGTPHERLFKLSGDLRYLSWHAGWFCSKIGQKCFVDLEKVLRIMQGQNTFQFQRYSNIYGDASEKSFSIVYLNKNNQERTLNLIAPSPDIFKLWFGGLRALVKKLQEQRQNYSLDSLYLKSLWDRADADHSGTLNMKEVVQLVASINVNLPNDKVRSLYKRFDVNQDGTLDFNEFVEFMGFLRKRPDIEAIWNCIVAGTALPSTNEPLEVDDEEFPAKDAVISLEVFTKFWEEEQGESLTVEEAQDLVEFCNSSTSDAKSKGGAGRGRRDGAGGGHNATDADQSNEATQEEFVVSYQMFANVLMNHTSSSLFDPAKLAEYQDMTQPLSYYCMASSHNTYLEGDQLTSFSSVNRYVSDLLSGCRCVELDCWDGDNGQPIICHGGTLTGKILFKDVIRAIYEYGFVASPYPVVLSIENHCSLDQQKTLAKIMVDILKDTLAMPIKDADPNFMLPSPEELRHKVLIKGKRLADAAADEAEDDEDDDDDDDAADGGKGGKRISAGGDAGDGAAAATGKQKKKKEAKVKTHPDLSAITYLGTGKVKKFSKEISASIPADMMCSYSEGTTNKNMRVPETVYGWIEHNKTHLSRIYPKGTRIDSSNYSPVTPWAGGNQLVALNYQTGDLPYHINFGKFLENGSCGYVIKPEYMINPAVQEPSEGIKLVINVISASHLPKPGGAQKGEIIDPFCVIYLSGPAPGDNQESRTRTINDNGFNPTWNQTFTFDVKRPDLSYLTFHVNDEDVISHDFIAFCSLPVSCLRPGLRTMQLRNLVGKRDQDFEYASLFVRIDIEPLEV